MRRIRLATPTILIVCSLLTAAPAFAATEIGSRCAGGSAMTNAAFQTVDPDAAGYAVPAAGVITRWGTNNGGGPGWTRLKVGRQTAPGTYLVVGESSTEPTIAGENGFATRIPVATGDRLGALGVSSFGLCPGLAPATISASTIVFDPSLGSAIAFNTSSTAALAVWAKIEPDADGDGYGDESQDACPLDPERWNICKPRLSGRLGGVDGRSARVVVTVDRATSVRLTGRIRLPAAGGRKSRRLVFSSKPLALAPATATTLKLNFPRTLRTALARLSSRRTLSLRLTAVAGSRPDSSQQSWAIKPRGTKK
jgi:hypothetical protein